ncbi:MAG: hypothetical protein QGG19_14005 [Alphaproteobacteria bacterium]|jgi:hypothetical protein|nr:hypothetical protein [Alphaproteobacteria bacterium]MDP6254447.1 hypothetical protein [Alphaproteobacteria bacterium]MDP7053784.1 hypothetical protein [Alphaproteobacteria bacterium]MDP7227690.1 hypothetical protein [Alphaproteobacteria bacterium]MDP7459476.1 hypothetical protein [Alphaproteobacteria bacterium]
MSLIITDPSTLNKHRQRVQKIFKPLAKTNHVDVFFRSGTNKVAIGLGRDTYGSDLSRARHPSRYDSIYVNYFEIWIAQEAGETFFLEKSCMHLDTPYPDGTGDEEVLALHCDPSLDGKGSESIFKRGPHLHLSGNRRDIKRAILHCI